MEETKSKFSKQSMARFSKIRRTIDCFTWQLIERFKAQEANCYTLDQELEYMRDWIYGAETYKKLPGWAKRELDGVLSVLRKQQDRKLVWTHVLDGVRLESGTKAFEGRYNEIDDTLSCHCWRKPDGTFVPYNLRTEKQN